MADTTHETVPELYIHVKQSGWGLAVITREENDHRDYQFQDGALRTFKRGYYELLKPVDRPIDEAREIVEQLLAGHEVSTARARVVDSAKKAGHTLVSFTDQVRLFLHFYPGGFSDPTYLATVRGGEGVASLKRHRQPAIARAQEQLGQEALDALIADGDFSTVYARALALVRTNEVTGTKERRAPLEFLAPERHPAFARALRDLLHGEGAYADRFNAYLAILNASRTGHDQPLTWSLATLLQGLVHPDLHICVRASAFRDQANWLTPRLTFQDAPSARLYQSLLTMALNVRERLVQAGLAPTDLFDVHDFIWESLRPQAKQLLKSLPGTH